MMNKRQENELSNRMDRLVNKDFAIFEWWELYTWFNAERLGKTVYRDLQARYEAAGGEDSLIFLNLKEGLMLIVKGSCKELADLM